MYERKRVRLVPAVPEPGCVSQLSPEEAEWSGSGRVAHWLNRMLRKGYNWGRFLIKNFKRNDFQYVLNEFCIGGLHFADL